jgi:hypothetical protein
LTLVPKIVCYSSQKWPETDVFREIIKFETVWPEDLPCWCYALNYGWYVEEGPVGDRPRGPLKQWGNPYLNSCINIS